MDVVYLAITAGLATLVTVFFQQISKKVQFKLEQWKIQTRSLHFEGLTQLKKWYEIIETLKNLDYVDCVLIFTGRNGGGVPEPGRPYYVSARIGFSTVKNDVAKMYEGPLPIDSYYMGYLLDMIKNQVFVITIKDMPITANIYKYYQEEGVVQAIWYPLRVESTELLYCSIASYKKNFEPHEMAKISMIIEKLRGLMA